MTLTDCLLVLLVLTVQPCFGFLFSETAINNSRKPFSLERNLHIRLEDDSLASSLGKQYDTIFKKQQNDNTPTPDFVLNTFLSSPPTATAAECDDFNRPPSLNILLRTLSQLTRGGSSTDIRGKYVNHKRLGSMAAIAHEIGRQAAGPSGGPHAPLTPFAAYCLGHGFARLVQELKSIQRQQRAIRQHQQQQQEQQPDNTAATVDNDENGEDSVTTIVVGQDPRPHGSRLADAFCRGTESVLGVKVLYTGIATTPACAAFCRLKGADASVMVTASHLPLDRNGFKMYFQGNCLSLKEIALVGSLASQCAVEWYQKGTVPPSSGHDAILAEWVDYMPVYANSLKQAIQSQVTGSLVNGGDKCLKGLKVVVNSGHGSGGFFAQVLSDLGANVEGSIGLEPDPTFPLGIPNPEYKPMIDATIQACQSVQADLGIMLDTDSDRCGFVVPVNSKSHENTGSALTLYEPLNRNRLIALMGVILAREHPQGCGVVTDSVTSEGLAAFLQDKLGLTHVRYLKGYQNVIDKAKELTESGILIAELAMETSGHGAMRENFYLDDGTYTAVKVVSLLAQERQKQHGSNNKCFLLDLIADMVELDVIRELRFQVLDNTLETMREVFDFCALEIEALISNEYGGVMDQIPASWSLDKENLEGIRVRVGGGQFFMLRKSLHDPILSLQLEAYSMEEASKLIVQPLLQLFESQEQIKSRLDLSVLQEF